LNKIECDSISFNGQNILTGAIKPGNKPTPLNSYITSPEHGFEMITVEFDISVRLDGQNLTSKEEFLYGPIVSEG
jgi:hypothetical protein